MLKYDAFESKLRRGSKLAKISQPRGFSNNGGCDMFKRFDSKLHLCLIFLFFVKAKWPEQGQCLM